MLPKMEPPGPRALASTIQAVTDHHFQCRIMPDCVRPGPAARAGAGPQVRVQLELSPGPGRPLPRPTRAQAAGGRAAGGNVTVEVVKRSYGMLESPAADDCFAGCC